ncbi:unnamed protein product [Haemonchus placei]|uniref:AN1-type domain-containing protein n=1 Tax=Haemonchus placei TaxID=6290 RepID=A0A3P7W3Q8_HAEPC|nr:unnamed protein product [Haemonchus placei]
MDTLDEKDIMAEGIKEWKQIKLKDSVREPEMESATEGAVALLPLDEAYFQQPCVDTSLPHSDHRFTHGCDNSKQYDPNAAVASSSGPLRNFLCSYSDCNGAESIKIVCPYCERNYCLKHRHADEHCCENRPEKVEKPRPQLVPALTAPTTSVEKPVKKAKPVTKISEADRKKMDKILIMKLKMNAKATADVPAEERMFLFVDGDDLSERKAVVVSKKWTVGRCASNIAKMLSLDELKTLHVFLEGSEKPLDYADTVSEHLNDMDTIIVQLV